MVNIIPQKIKVEILLSLGGKRWIKNGMDRIYLGESALNQLLGTEVGYYRTNSLKNCKYYYDLCSDSYGYKHYEGCIDQHDAIYNKLDEYLLEKYNAHNKAKALAEAEREVTMDELNAALGF